MKKTAYETMANLSTRLREGDVRITNLMRLLRDIDRGAANRVLNFPPMCSRAVQLINATRSIWPNVEDIESWLNEERAATILREMLLLSPSEDDLVTTTPSWRLLQLIVQSLLVVPDNGLSLRRRRCLFANCHHTVDRFYFRRGQDLRSVDMNVILRRSGGHWCVGSIPLYPEIRLDQNTR